MADADKLLPGPDESVPVPAAAQVAPPADMSITLDHFCLELSREKPPSAAGKYSKGTFGPEAIAGFRASERITGKPPKDTSENFRSRFDALFEKKKG